MSPNPPGERAARSDGAGLRARGPGFAAVFLAALGAYVVTAFAVEQTQSPNMAYFDALARSFLHGKLHLDPPPHTADLTERDGRWFVPFPPLPAVLMLPWIAIGKPLNSIWFSAIFAAFNVALVDRFLATLARHGDIALHGARRLWLTAFFALGLPWYMSIQGEVWFIAHVCTTTFLAVAALAAASGASSWWTGIALALAVAGRPHVALNWFFLLGLEQHRRTRLMTPGDHAVAAGNWSRWIVGSTIPVVLVGDLLAAYNVARFNDPLDFGYAHQNVGAEVAGDLHAYGLFHPYFITRNAWTMLIRPPEFSQSGWLVPSEHGMGLLLTCPAIVYIIAVVRRREPWIRGAWASLFAIIAILLFYYNTGWRQFGYRFSMDFIMPLTALLAAAASASPQRGLRALILFGVIVNAWGVAWWYHQWP